MIVPREFKVPLANILEYYEEEHFVTIKMPDGRVRHDVSISNFLHIKNRTKPKKRRDVRNQVAELMDNRFMAI